MNEWIEKRRYIADLGRLLRFDGATISIRELAILLNAAAYRTDVDHHPYAGGRGTYRLVASTWQWLQQQGRVQEAEDVAEAFVKCDGRYAWN
jgi:ABC-type taurine transport system substrate-binding protein